MEETRMLHLKVPDKRCYGQGATVRGCTQTLGSTSRKSMQFIMEKDTL